METENAMQEQMCKGDEAQKEHHWLQKLVGEWTSEVQMVMPPDQPAESTTSKGTESVRSLGGLWVVAEGKGEMPGGAPATTQLTLGYDPVKKRFVGTWVGSMMTHLWIYEGELDADKKVLTLYAEGPSMMVEGQNARYKDVTTLVEDDYRVLTSYAQGEDGQWQLFVTTHYRRVK